MNSKLRGHEFPLPVIEDMLLGQAGNHLWSIIDLKYGSQKMPQMKAAANAPHSTLPVEFVNGVHCPWV